MKAELFLDNGYREWLGYEDLMAAGKVLHRKGSSKFGVDFTFRLRASWCRITGTKSRRGIQDDYEGRVVF